MKHTTAGVHNKFFEQKLSDLLAPSQEHGASNGAPDAATLERIEKTLRVAYKGTPTVEERIHTIRTVAEQALLKVLPAYNAEKPSTVREAIEQIQERRRALEKLQNLQLLPSDVARKSAMALAAGETEVRRGYTAEQPVTLEIRRSFTTALLKKILTRMDCLFDDKKLWAKVGIPGEIPDVPPELIAEAYRVGGRVIYVGASIAWMAKAISSETDSLRKLSNWLNDRPETGLKVEYTGSARMEDFAAPIKNPGWRVVPSHQYGYLPGESFRDPTYSTKLLGPGEAGKIWDQQGQSPDRMLPEEMFAMYAYALLRGEGPAGFWDSARCDGRTSISIVFNKSRYEPTVLRVHRTPEKANYSNRRVDRGTCFGSLAQFV